LRDPIYADIAKLAAAFEAAALSEKSKAEKAEIEYNKAEMRSIDRKTLKRDLEKAQETGQKAAQQAEYYKIKLRLREAEAKIAYKKAFAAGKDWPDPAEYESYQHQKKMRETSRNWRDRLPKPGEPTISTPAGGGDSD
jgi:hypothetical protein